MDPPSRGRERKFVPKAPPRRPPKPIVTKIEDDSDDDEEAQQILNRKLQEHLRRRGPNTENRPQTQVAFSHGSTSNAIRTFGKQKEKIADKGKDANLDDNWGKVVPSLQPTPGTEELGERSMVVADGSSVKKKKDYREPWDYNGYYPTTLPWRKPKSGNPEILNEAEFGESMEYDENAINSASELGLLENREDDEGHMIFFQFPPNLPLGEKARSLAELPKGHMGKMLVYKSGAVKLKLGDVLFDVSPGSGCVSAQEVAAVNVTNKHFCLLGEVNKKAVVLPDI